VAKKHQPELDANHWLRSWKCSSAELLRFRRVKRASDGLKGPRKMVVLMVLMVVLMVLMVV
jgi:hypothetical protein